jgi:hypothetical protein
MAKAPAMTPMAMPALAPPERCRDEPGVSTEAAPRAEAEDVCVLADRVDVESVRGVLSVGMAVMTLEAVGVAAVVVAEGAVELAALAGERADVGEEAALVGEAGERVADSAEATERSEAMEEPRGEVKPAGGMMYEGV